MEGHNDQKLSRFLILFLICCLPVASGHWPLTKVVGVSSNASHLKYVASEIEEGDLIFRLGKGVWSPLFSDVKGSAFSHVGVLVKENQHWVVAHSEADDYTLEGGVHTTPLESFLNESADFQFKHNGMNEKQKQEFLDFIRYQVKKGTKFDTDFNLESADALYCTELIWLAAKKADVSLGEPVYYLGKPYITVDILFYSPIFNQTLPLIHLSKEQYAYP